MIESRLKLKKYLLTEKKLYQVAENKLPRVLDLFKGEWRAYRWRFIKHLRKAEYFHFKRKRNPFYYLCYIWHIRRKNSIGRKLGMDLKENVFEEGLVIHHTVGIVVNSQAKVGRNCILHGGNIIGNMGENTGSPVIGNNVRLGAGAKVLGDIYIADGVQIGAGALVIHSCNEEGALLVGVPAVKKRRKIQGIRER